LTHKEQEEWLRQQPVLIQIAFKKWPLGELLKGEFSIIGYGHSNEAGKVMPIAMLTEKGMHMGDYFGENGEDRIIRSRCILPNKGVFVDIGAGEPIVSSNSLSFEIDGWKVLCVDADVRQIEKFNSSGRKCLIEHCIVGIDEGMRDFFQCKEYANHSTVLKDRDTGHGGTKKVSLPCHTLETLLMNHLIDKIDILSIDVEGIDLEVWSSMIWENHKPSVVIIEGGSLETNEKIRSEFQNKGYKLAEMANYNFIWALPEALKTDDIQASL